jgi:hypothetical protein
VAEGRPEGSYLTLAGEAYSTCGKLSAAGERKGTHPDEVLPALRLTFIHLLVFYRTRKQIFTIPSSRLRVIRAGETST